MPLCETGMNTTCKFLYFIRLLCIILAGDGRITSIINLGDIMRILVIFTGGTIGSTENGSYVSPDKEKPYKLINMYKKLAIKNKGSSSVIFDILTPYEALSENINCNNFRILSECLEKVDENAYDGVIITHGTDTLQYTAAFTGYIMAGAQIPIVLVSANYVLEDVRSNGVDNFYYAVEFICHKNIAYVIHIMDILIKKSLFIIINIILMIILNIMGQKCLMYHLEAGSQE